MKISWKDVWFPFADERRMEKLAIGGGIVLLSGMFFPLLWLLQGYGLRIMKQTIEGEEPSLPEWDEWGELFIDGIKVWVVGLFYNIPIFILMCCMMGVIGVGMAVAGTSGDPTLFILSYIFSFMVMGIGTLVALPLMFLQMVALTRMVATDSLNSAFEIREVWELARRGFTNYLFAVIVWYGATIIFSMAAYFLMYTIILSCLYFIALPVLVVYTTAVQNALLGMAYRATGKAAKADKALPAAE